ncbi:PNPOx family protein [Actinacidiphila yeochonensis]|uniref:hypothetical protein n=1 Tax=Actinacidiphila yeochonensis TaxID=89050 RepID=UPI000ADA3708|nr:hypothetical protein [Actinacidiphila yeochonensis]
MDVGGFATGTAGKRRNVAANPSVSLVVDDMARLGDPSTARGVEIRGRPSRSSDRTTAERG